MKVGIIRVLSDCDDSVLYAHEKIIKKTFPQLEIITRAIENQPMGIHDEITEGVAIPKIINLAIEMESIGVDGIIISCCMDPGLDLIRSKVSIPVVGAGQAACLLAKSISSNIGVLSLADNIPSNIDNLLASNLSAYIKPKGIKNTLDLLSESGKKSVINAAKILIEKGANCIVLGCTGMATIGIANVLEKELKIPVIDPIVASGSIINYLVNRNNWQR